MLTPDQIAKIKAKIKKHVVYVQGYPCIKALGPDGKWHLVALTGSKRLS